MNIIPLPGHEQAWNEFCRVHYWFWHTTMWQEYLTHSRFGVEYRNHSFALEQDGSIIGIVPLIQEDDQLISPGFDDDKEILAEVRRIALENGCKRVQVNSDIKSYLSIPSYTCVLDLDSVRPTKGHRSAIKKAEKYLSWREIADIDRFRADYFQIAGRETRPARTFALLKAWIKQGYGTLLEAEFDELTAGYGYVLHWQDRAYYFMSAVFPYFKPYNVSHYLLWRAFDVLRKKGVRQIELGEQVFCSLSCQPTEKERNISRFKRGFGGNIIRIPKSEYFFDMLYFKEIMHGRIDSYIDSEYKV